VKGSIERVTAVLQGDMPDRAPMFDLLRNDAVINHIPHLMASRLQRPKNRIDESSSRQKTGSHLDLGFKSIDALFDSCDVTGQSRIFGEASCQGLPWLADR